MVSAKAAFTNSKEVGGSRNPLFQYEVMNMAKKEKMNILVKYFISLYCIKSCPLVTSQVDKAHLLFIKNLFPLKNV